MVKAKRMFSVAVAAGDDRTAIGHYTVRAARLKQAARKCLKQAKRDYSDIASLGLRVTSISESGDRIVSRSICHHG